MRLLRTVIVAVTVIAVAVIAITRPRGHHRTTATRPPASPATTATTATAPAHLSARVLVSKLPATLSRSAVVVEDGSVVILGGLTSSGSTARVLRFDPASGAVTVAGDLGVAVHDAAAALLSGDAFVFGGGGERSTVATVQRFSGSASRTAGRLPQPRSDLVAVNAGGHAIVLGGFDGTNATPDVLETDDGATYRVLTQLPVSVRYPAVAVAGSTVYLFGGQRGTSQTSSIQAIDVASGTARIVGQLPQPLSEATAWVQSGGIYIAGGRHGSAVTADMLRFDPATGQITAAGTLPAPEADAPVGVVGDRAYLFGGEGAGRLATIVEVSVDGRMPA